MARWMHAVSRSRSRFQSLVKPFAAVLHSFDEAAKQEQFVEEDPKDQRAYETLAARMLDAVGPALERMITEELCDHPELLRPRR